MDRETWNLGAQKVSRGFWLKASLRDNKNSICELTGIPNKSFISWYTSFDFYKHFITFIYLDVYSIYVFTRTKHHRKPVELKRQLAGSSFLFYHVGLGNMVQVVGLAGKCPYTLSHLASIWLINFMTKYHYSTVFPSIWKEIKLFLDFAPLKLDSDILYQTKHIWPSSEPNCIIY